MTHDDALTPDEEAVRRALASARYTDPVPADVAARLDATLASLAAELSPASAEQKDARPLAPVVEFAGRTRRRRGVVGLVAAAAVVAAVATVPSWWPSRDESTMSGVATADRAEAGSATLAEPSENAARSAQPSESQAELPSPAAEGKADYSARTLDGVSALTSGPSAADQVKDLLSSTNSSSLLSAAASADSSCFPAALGARGVQFTTPVTWDGTPAWLVQRSANERTVARVIDCQGRTLYRLRLS